MAEHDGEVVRRRSLVVAVLLLALAVRLAIVVPAINRPPNDPDNYLTLARSMANGRGFSLVGRLTAYRPPLYPILLVPVVSALGDETAGPFLLLNVLFGVATVGAIVVASRRLGWSEWRTAAAGVIVACDPVLAVQSRSIMTESLAALLVALSLMSFCKGSTFRSTFSGGAWLGLASLCRPSLLAASIFASVAAFAVGPGSRRERFLRSGVLVGATILVLLPWALRNARVFGEPVWTTTHGGYTLALANNPEYYRDVLEGGSAEVWSGPGQRKWAAGVYRRTRGMTEPQANRRLAADGWSMALEEPRTFFRASLARLGRFWGVMPSRSVYGRPLRLASAFWTIPLFAALLLGVATGASWRWPRASALACVLALTSVHALYWTDLRMRAPVVPAMALIAAGGAVPMGRSAPKRAPDGDRK